MKTAVYPGSFDPITMGHLDIIERAAGIFDKVCVCIMVNSAKSGCFDPQTRAQLVRSSVAHIDNVQCVVFDGLLADFVRTVDNAVIVKGARSVRDFEDELQMARINKNLPGSPETLILCSQPEYMHVSSTVARELARYGAPLEGVVPPCIADDITNFFVNRRI